jgi:hypothetical protein
MTTTVRFKIQTTVTNNLSELYMYDPHGWLSAEATDQGKQLNPFLMHVT